MHQRTAFVVNFQMETKVEKSVVKVAGHAIPGLRQRGFYQGVGRALDAVRVKKDVRAIDQVSKISRHKQLQLGGSAKQSHSRHSRVLGWR